MPQQPATSFADDLQKTREGFAADLASARQHVDDQSAVPHPVVERLLNWLPAVGGVVGGVLGGPGGAALGGASGEAFSQLGNRTAGNPAPATSEEAAKDIALAGVSQGLGEGIGQALPALSKLAPAVMTKAAKPAAALLEDFRTTAPALAKTLLDSGVNVTRTGVEKLTSLLKSTQGELRTLLADSTAVIDKNNILAEVGPTASRIADQPNPMSDLEAVGKQVEGLQNHPKYPGPTMTPAEAQALKTGTYQKIAGSYGERGSATVEADKAIARGAKNEINAKVPEAAGLNAKEANLMAARDAVAKQVGLAANRDTGALTWLARNPETAMGWLLEKSPAVKSLVARGLYSTAAAATGLPAGLIRTIVHSVAGLPEEAGVVK